MDFKKVHIQKYHFMGPTAGLKAMRKWILRRVIDGSSICGSLNGTSVYAIIERPPEHIKLFVIRGKLDFR